MRNANVWENKLCASSREFQNELILFSFLFIFCLQGTCVIARNVLGSGKNKEFQVIPTIRLPCTKNTISDLEVLDVV